MRTPSINKRSSVFSLPPSPRLRRTCLSAVSPLTSVLRPPTSRPRAGFTLLELLIVIALIMLLAGLMIPAFYKVKSGANEKKKSVETRVIGAAIQAYKLQERKLPAPDAHLGGGADRSYGEGGSDGNNSQVMRLLRETNPPVLDPNKLRWEGENVINPDGDQYKITLDLNYDGEAGGVPGDYKVE